MTAPKEKQALEREDLVKLYGGSAATGAGLALLATLVETLRSEKRRRKAREGSGSGTLTLQLPTRKEAVFTQLLGGAAIGGTSYLVVRKLLNKMREAQLKEEAEKAQEAYLRKLVEPEGEIKTAVFDKIKLLDFLHDIPLDIFTIGALGGGIGTYGLLNSTFPRVKEKGEADGRPKKIVVKGYGTVLADGPGDGPLGRREENGAVDPGAPATEAGEGGDDVKEVKKDLRKAATIECGFGYDDHLAAAELLCRALTVGNHTDKRANSLKAWLGYGLVNGSDRMEDFVKEAGVAALLELLDGEQVLFNEASDAEKTAAISGALASEALAPTTALLAMAELHEVCPAVTEAVVKLADDEVTMITGTKLAAVLLGIEKTANDDSPTLGLSVFHDRDGEVEEADAVYGGKADPIDKFLSSKSEIGATPMADKTDNQ